MAQAEPSAQLLTRAVKRHWRGLVVCTLTFAVAGGVYGLVRAPKYTSHASVLIAPLAANALSPVIASNPQASGLAMDTEAGLVKSAAVTRQLNATLHAALKAGSNQIKASPVANTQLIKIEYTDSTPAAAQAYAQGYAQAYLAYRTILAAQIQRAQVASLTAQRTKLQATLKQATARAAQHPPPAGAQGQVQAATSSLVTVQANLATAQAPLPASGSVVAAASLPTKPGSRTGILIAVGAGLLGLLIALALAMWRERRDDRIRSREETILAGLPVLAAVPVGAGLTPPEHEAQLEALRRARAGLVALAAPPTTIAVCGIKSTDATVDVLLGLAQRVADAGYRVTVVDARITDPHLGAALGLTDDIGLTDLLADSDTPAFELAEINGYRVLAIGPDPESARDRLSGARFREVLVALQADADYVFVHSEPVSSAEGLSTVATGGSVLFVATDLSTTHEAIATAAEQAQRIGITPIGVLTVRSGRRARKSARPSASPAGPRSVAASAEDDSAAARASVEGESVIGETPTEDEPQTASEDRDLSGAAGQPTAETDTDDEPAAEMAPEAAAEIETLDTPTDDEPEPGADTRSGKPRRLITRRSIARS